MVEAEGLEPTAPPNKTKGAAWVCTRKLTPRSLPPEVQDAVRAWKYLPASIQMAILHILRIGSGKTHYENLSG